ncbi:MAG TPA: tRNA (adenosine(37)-N6)-dimethylallyltransferase MiaA [Burkholderiales bacterium]|nr:tRNA (adenosine(37)-N6)-dimethylallyltransferase MiaA [Burkholderiales bacterium]
MQKAAFVLLGPTASGKSRLALELAEKVPLEIVAMDSAQVYRGMDIGTAKPSAADQARVPHHLIDLIDPQEAYSAGRWRDEAVRVATGILEKNRIPLLVGGTMLYYRVLTSGLAAMPSADPELRAELDLSAARRGWPSLHADLAKVDPEAAQRIQPNDAQRIQRALEVWKLTGEPLSKIQLRKDAPLPFALKPFALVPERAELHARIAERFAAMLAAGLIDEVRSLKTRFALHPGLPSMRAVGYRQVWEFLEGRFGEDELRSRGIAATRQLAKRQLTWLRSFSGIETVLSPAVLAERLAHSFL